MRFPVSRTALAILLAIAATGFVSCQNNDLPDGLYARMATSKGEIVISLEYAKAPLTVGNFIGLAEGTLDAAKGKRFYDGLAFHRVEPGFVIQGGDPNGDGSGGPGYEFDDEFSPDLKHTGPGMLSMANSGPGTNGSQFFITLGAAPWLDGLHSVFGKVVKGMDVAQKIAVGDKIVKLSIIRVGKDAKAFKADQQAWNDRQKTAAEAAAKRSADKRIADLAAIAATWPGLKADANGILFKVLKEGSGNPPARGATVSVRYKAMFIDGKPFDESDQAGAPQEFRVGLGEILPGWDLAVGQMRLGEKRMVVIPPELGFGARGGANGLIPPNSFLAFEFDLVGIK